MDERYLMAMKGVSRRQQFEVAEVGAQHDDTAARIAPLELIPVLKALVGHAHDEPAMEKSGQAYVLGGAAPQVQVGGAYNTPAVALAALRKRDRQVYHPDRHMAAVSQVNDIAAEHSDWIQNKIGQQAERGHDGAHQLEEQPVLSPELEPGQRRTLARGAGCSRSPGGIVSDGGRIAGGGDVRAGWRGGRGRGCLLPRGVDEARGHRLCCSRLGALAITTRPESVT